MDVFDVKWVAVLAVFFILLLEVRPASAQSCTSPTDCDGNGVDNLQQPCPADASLSATPHGGFIDARCFEPLLNQALVEGLPAGPCTVVAARRVHDDVDKDPLEAGTKPGTKKVDGVVFVGTYEVGTGIDYGIGIPQAIMDLHPSASDEVKKGFGTGKYAPRPLFACIGSAKFNPDGSLGNPTWVYGFRIAASYTWAILDAATHSSKPAFPDALGLVRELRKDKSGWVNGLAGTNGTLWDSSHWSTDVSPLTSIKAGDLPEYVTAVVDQECAAKAATRLDDTNHTPYKVVPWFVDPLGPKTDVSNPVYQDWPGASSSVQFWNSPLGKATLAGMTPFGQKASVMQNGGAGAAVSGGPPGTQPPPGPDPNPKNDVLYGPKDQFIESGSVAYLTGATLTSDDSPTDAIACKQAGPGVNLPGNGSGIPGLAAAICACELTTPLLMFRRPKDAQDKMPPFLPEDVLYGKKAGSWSAHFQDGAPSPRTVSRPLDELAGRLNGDAAFNVNAGTSVGTPNQEQFAPTMP